MFVSLFLAVKSASSALVRERTKSDRYPQVRGKRLSAFASSGGIVPYFAKPRLDPRAIARGFLLEQLLGQRRDGFGHAVQIDDVAV